VIIETALEALREAAQKGHVQNPAEFFNKAVRHAWKPNELFQEKTEMNSFNDWWKVAYSQGLLGTATQVDDVQQVLTTEGRWVPFSEMVDSHPLQSL